MAMTEDLPAQGPPVRQTIVIPLCPVKYPCLPRVVRIARKLGKFKELFIGFGELERRRNRVKMPRKMHRLTTRYTHAESILLIMDASREWEQEEVGNRAD